MFSEKQWSIRWFKAQCVIPPASPKALSPKSHSASLEFSDVGLIWEVFSDDTSFWKKKKKKKTDGVRHMQPLPQLANMKVSEAVSVCMPADLSLWALLILLPFFSTCLICWNQYSHVSPHTHTQTRTQGALLPNSPLLWEHYGRLYLEMKLLVQFSVVRARGQLKQMAH